jgi:tetratricopeptide (TPR) repeat protein
VAAEAIGDPASKAQALSGVATTLAEVGEREAALHAAREALVAAIGIQFLPPRARALSAVATALADMGEGEVAARAAREALVAAEAIRDVFEPWKAEALSGVAGALADVGDLEALREALVAAEAIGGEDSKARALSGVVAALARLGDVQALHQAQAAAEAIEDEGSRAQGLSGVAQAWTRIDQPDQALTTLSAAFRAARLAGRPSVFHVLEKAAPALAELDAGRVLGQIVQAIREVEGWWGAGPVRPERGLP